jgi:alpha-amylase/alpha-mannosidase (GH57 family)
MPIPIAIIWHQHQPYYKDLASGEMMLPWVRLHGIKDYYGMARLLQEFPGMRCTINLVPSMLAQLQDYVEHNATDPFLRHTTIAADALSDAEIHFILDHFFMAQWDRMIRVHPRYGQLLEMRRLGRRPVLRAAEEYTKQDIRDLQMWFNLAWFHPVSFEESQTLRELRNKGRDFSENDKAVLLDEQKKVLARVIPLHKELMARQQLELTTTPFYHPILPLLCDMKSAQIAMPGTPLPKGHVALLEDAEMQIKRAVDYHKQLFGAAPEGMWPSEGSVSPEMVPLVARHGIKWIATDEEILSASISSGLRNGSGVLERPELLYRGWQCGVGGANVNMLFRDHHLSDLIGFQYQGWEGEAAADDFIARATAHAADLPAGGETIVPVVLDGENCWEHYHHQGIDFLRALYGKLQRNDGPLLPVRVSDFMKAHPPAHRIERLFSGSWINHDFYIWAGHAEDRRAWEYVYRTREDLLNASAAGTANLKATPESLAKAWEELYIAEGSDWFWWYGDDHSSGNDGAFDDLFRKHLKNVYTFAGLEPPAFLNIAVKGLAHARRFTLPQNSLSIQVDGRVTNYFEWLGAGRYRPDKEGGVMTAANASLVDQIFFGYDRQHLCVRVDLRSPNPADPTDASAAAAAHQVKGIVVRFTAPQPLALMIDPLKLDHPQYEGLWKAPLNAAEIAWHEVLEFKIPFASIGVAAAQELNFYIEVLAPDRATERYPRSCTLDFAVPSENAHEQEWMV